MYRTGLRVLLFALAALFAFSAAAMSREARALADAVLRGRDNAGLPFAIVDKHQAELHVFDAHGQLAGSTPALLGSAYGDAIAPGVGERTQLGILRASDKTTPAGRFVSSPGINPSGEPVVWVDYESAFAIHRLRPGRALKSRTLRLASQRVADKRVSDGCVVVPVAFYLHVVQRVLGAGRAVVYVMPEARQRPVLTAFPADS